MGKKLIVIGLTGGIASGKSTVAVFLRKMDVPVIDADRLGHTVLEPDGEAYAPVIETFGRGILDSDDQIDRGKMGAMVFDNAELRSELEKITHPAIASLAKKGIELIAKRGEPLAFYEAALLIETGVFRGLDALVVTSCSVATQVLRVVERDGLSKEAAAVRIASQFPLEEKIAMADYVIDTDCPMEKTRAATADVLHKLRKRFALE